MSTLHWRVLLLMLSLTFIPLVGVLANTNGMDMSMDGAMSLASGNMLPYLHFTPGDVVWFQGWVPRSLGPMVGACIGLFLLALFDRWLAACRGLMELHWRRRALIEVANRMNTGASRPVFDSRVSVSSASSLPKEKLAATVEGLPAESNSRKSRSLSLRIITPFVPAYDIPRGAMQAAQSTLEFAFMLVVMTFQAAFILSIVVGLGVGEALFGRYNVQAYIY